jgi:hypothetical protein
MAQRNLLLQKSVYSTITGVMAQLRVCGSDG